MFQSKPSGSKEKEGVEEKDEDDEEEESGDEGDLSKYDLWGSEDERENKTGNLTRFFRFILELAVSRDPRPG